eukprot:Nitzschia sp. Nitz4//scaffold65_size103378//13011//13541//NITZ4_004455-RA/size103378-exonerate_est2genome-gene-0.71-mRNA-1//-1//CDS//3329556207//470//frame0
MKSFLLKNPFHSICFWCALIGSFSNVSAVKPTKAPKAQASPPPTSEPSNKPFLRPSVGPSAQTWALPSEVPTNPPTAAPSPGTTAISPAPSLTSCDIEITVEPECPDVECDLGGCHDTYIYPKTNFSLELEDETDVLELNFLFVVVLSPDALILPQAFEPSVTGVTIPPSYSASTEL